MFEPRFRSIDRGILGYKTRQNLACLYESQSRHAEAEQQWRAILAERPDYAVAWKGLVACLVKQGKAVEASTLVRDSEVLRQSPALFKQLAAEIEAALGNLAAARRILEQAVAESPDDFEPHDALCRFLFEHAKPEQTEVALQALVDKFPDNAAGLYNLATVRLLRGQYAAAATSYRQSIALRPNWPPAHEHLAMCYRAMGRQEEANQALEEFRHKVPRVHGKQLVRCLDNKQGPQFAADDAQAVSG
jgi:tetratricopeptide (TPR) repeat protein